MYFFYVYITMINWIIFWSKEVNLFFIFLLKKYQKFLESELANNQEKEKKVGVAERQAAKLRLEYQDSEQIRIQFQDEVNQKKTPRPKIWFKLVQTACNFYS